MSEYRNAKIIELTENGAESECYPTPASLICKMLDGIDFSNIERVLEPSAGKGDLAKAIAERMERSDTRYKEHFGIDLIEIDSNLRQILDYEFSEEKRRELEKKQAELSHGERVYDEYTPDGRRYYYYNESREKINLNKQEAALYRMYETLTSSRINENINVVHDDFLNYESFTEYDLVVMNPPFSEGAKHLLKALDVQKNGGSIVCLLNAETISNPYTEERKRLIRLLDKYGAHIEYVKNAFAEAERSARVDVAIVKVTIPNNRDNWEDSESIFEKLAKEENYTEPTEEEMTELEVTDYIRIIINKYKVEMRSGLRFLREYHKLCPYITLGFNKEEYRHGEPIIKLKDDMSERKFIWQVRYKYWRTLLSDKKFTSRLTEKLQEKYREKVSRFAEFDFSEFNIKHLICELNCQIKTGIEDEIVSMYDKLTEEHSWYPETTKNRYLYDGWKTNKAWKIGKKVILPCYGIVDSWNNRFNSYEANKKVGDIIRILNFFDGHMSEEIDYSIIGRHFSAGITKNIPLAHCNVTFYKKGTVHITFTDPELIDRYNIYVGRKRKWLPPSYGTKQYTAMTDEEKAVIDSFQGEESYNKVMSNPSYYLTSPTENTNVPLLSVS